MTYGREYRASRVHKFTGAAVTRLRDGWEPSVGPPPRLSEAVSVEQPEDFGDDEQYGLIKLSGHGT